MVYLTLGKGCPEWDVNPMNDELKLITLKMPVGEIEALSQYLMEHDIDNRSEFIRRCIGKTIEETTTEGKTSEEDGILAVHLNPVLLMTLDNMVKDGVIYDKESYVRSLVEKDIIPADIMDDSKARSFRSAQSSNRNA
jgi:hypothetical protein